MSSRTAARNNRDAGTERARQTRVLEAVALTITAAALLLGASSSGFVGDAPTRTTRVVLKSGDTLWSLAARHPAAGLDTARTADFIARVNDISAESLHEGQIVLVPAHAGQPNTYAMR